MQVLHAEAVLVREVNQNKEHLERQLAALCPHIVSPSSWCSSAVDFAAFPYRLCHKQGQQCGVSKTARENDARQSLVLFLVKLCRVWAQSRNLKSAKLRRKRVFIWKNHLTSLKIRLWGCFFYTDLILKLLNTAPFFMRLFIQYQRPQLIKIYPALYVFKP